ncbi:MAG TPA: hypothetical protein VF728_04765 [Nocardioides sp.]
MGHDLLAHGLGGPKDLPISLSLAIAGAVAALVLSFVVLAFAWRTPRFDPATAGRAVPWLDAAVSSPAWAWSWRVVGLVFFVYVGWAAVMGQDTLINPFLGVFYVLVWVGLVPASLLLGPVWKAVSPARTLNLLLAKVSGTDPESGMFTYPARLGYWPAAVGLFAFVWIELVYPHSTELGPVRLWCAAYLAVMLVGGALFGNTWLARADPFEVYSTLVGHLSVWGRRDGALVVRSPLANLATVTPGPGLVAVVGVLFGSTAFDSFKESVWWLQFTQGSAVSAGLLDNLALLAFCAAATGLFTVASMATGASTDSPRRALPGMLAHSVVPIIVGYIVAHYLRYLVEYGQTTFIQLSDPLSTGADYLGTADMVENRWLSYHPTFLANTKVIGVIVGHVLGVVAAHDRAIALLPKRHQLTGQLPLLVVMVCFTVGGLYLLFAA